jgi:hypothetical protein
MPGWILIACAHFAVHSWFTGHEFAGCLGLRPWPGSGYEVDFLRMGQTKGGGGTKGNGRFRDAHRTALQPLQKKTRIGGRLLAVGIVLESQVLRGRSVEWMLDDAVETVSNSTATGLTVALGIGRTTGEKGFNYRDEHQVVLAQGYNWG